MRMFLEADTITTKKQARQIRKSMHHCCATSTGNIRSCDAFMASLTTTTVPTDAMASLYQCPHGHTDSAKVDTS